MSKNMRKRDHELRKSPLKRVGQTWSIICQKLFNYRQSWNLVCLLPQVDYGFEYMCCTTKCITISCRLAFIRLGCW